ncbi:GNAT family N-acetyltransferase [Guptibacillus hwajinpoensis]|uniref:GNAT family N-acetyltransferase n=1 Tax=Guptibacillus hwajinpoensis TaxID=208199 RepID=UPI0037359F18
MNKKQIVQAIEAIQWDYEDALVPESIHYIQKDDVVMIKNEKSTSIYANKVVRFDKSFEEIEEVFAFFGESPFSWWVRKENHRELEDELIKRGLYHFDTYVGLAKVLHKKENEVDTQHSYKEVMVEEEVSQHVQVASSIWNYDRRTEEAAFSERVKYIEIPDRRGGYMVVVDNELPIAYSNYRYSHDDRVLYLNGAGVIPRYRGKGIYREMVARRLNEAISRGCQIAVTQAKKGTSEPILRKVGFQEYATYKQYVPNQ